jgi:peptidase M28-like protein
MTLHVLTQIEELVAFEGRWPGTDAERRAAGHLKRRLEELGRECRVEPIRVRPGYPIVHALHALIAVIGSALSVSSPGAGMALVLAAAISTFGDLTGMFFLARRLLPVRASQNVVSPEDGGRPGILVLSAHYDAARTGAVFSRRAVERRTALSALVRRQIGPFEPVFWSMMLVAACVLLRLLGLEGTGLTVVQFIPTVLLIASVPLFLDIALSGVVPGASDNASGVATVLRLAERHGKQLDHFDVWVLLPGAEEGLLLGMREWLRRHRGELATERVVFLNVDTVGNGTVRYTTKEGFLLASPYHPTLVQLCREIADEDEQDGRRYGARPYVSRSVSDAHAARTRGFAAITIRCLNALDYAANYHQPTDTPDRIDPDALERAFEFCSELIELIDERIGPQLAGAPET